MGQLLSSKPKNTLCGNFFTDDEPLKAKINKGMFSRFDVTFDSDKPFMPDNINNPNAMNIDIHKNIFILYQNSSLTVPSYHNMRPFYGKIKITSPFINWFKGSFDSTTLFIVQSIKTRKHISFCLSLIDGNVLSVIIFTQSDYQFYFIGNECEPEYVKIVLKNNKLCLMKIHEMLCTCYCESLFEFILANEYIVKSMVAFL